MTDWHDHGWTPLTDACPHANLGAVKMLLNRGADTERAGSGTLGDSGRTAMMRAAIRGHYDVVGIMAEGRANVTVKGNDGCSVWRRAKKDGRFDVCEASATERRKPSPPGVVMNAIERFQFRRRDTKEENSKHR